jgi:hypothetical protein
MRALSAMLEARWPKWQPVGMAPVCQSYVNNSQTPAARLAPASVAICPPEQLRQPRNVDGDPSRLVLRQQLRLPRLVLVVAGVELRDRLPVGIPDDVTAENLVGAPARGKSAGCHRGGGRNSVWPPLHRRDLQRRSLPRIDPLDSSHSREALALHFSRFKTMAHHLPRCASIQSGRRLPEPSCRIRVGAMSGLMQDLCTASPGLGRASRDES